MSPARGCSARAFTLMEVAVVLALMTLLGAAMVSVITLSTRAMPAADDASLEVVNLASGADLMLEELIEATAIVSRGATHVEFDVPDRDADLVEERVRYEWDGKVGDPVTRAVNGAEPIVVVASADAFDVRIDEEVVDVTLPPTYETSAEALLASYTAAGSHDFPLTKNDHNGQYALPASPADAVSWSVTRVRIMAKRSTDSGSSITVDLRVPNADRTPSSTILGSATILKSSLGGTNAWVDVPVTANGLAPGSGVCLVAAGDNTKSAATIRWQSGGVPASLSAAMLRSTDGGAAWSVQTSNAMLHEIYGTFTTATVISGSRTHARRVRVEIARGPVAHRGARVLPNRPEVMP